MLLSAVLLLIQGCVVPRTISVYDEECKVVAKQMVLDVQSANAVAHCSNRECVGQAIGVGVVLATTAVVSGSIVVAGNVVYWLEKKRNCQPSKTIPEPANADPK
jgi:hypothetical protein